MNLIYYLLSNMITLQTRLRFTVKHNGRICFLTIVNHVLKLVLK